MKIRLFISTFKDNLHILWVFVLIFPILNQWIPISRAKELEGVFLTKDTTKIDSWWDGSFQKKQEAKLNHLKLRNFCFRLRNQIEFSLLSRINAEQMYLHSGVIFRMDSPTYKISSYFNGFDRIKEEFTNLNEYRKSKGAKPIIFIIPPFKFDLYSKQLPWYNKTNNKLSNYSVYTKKLLAEKYDLIDTKSWFLKESKNPNAPVFIERGGVHWTSYAATIAMDSLVSLAEIKFSKKYLHPEYTIKKNDGTIMDYDGFGLSNLLWTKHDKNSYLPVYSEPQEGQKLKALIVSDSYFHVIHWTTLFPQIFEKSSVFYYYMHTRVQSDLSETPFNQVQFEKDLEKADMIIVISEVNNLTNFAFGLPKLLNSKLHRN